MGEPARKAKKSMRQQEQLLRLLDVARYMGEKRNLDDLLYYIAEQGTIALGCDRSSIFLHDPEQKEIWSKVAQGQGDIIRFPEDTGIAGATIRSGQVIRIDDAYRDKRFNSNIDRSTGYKTHNILSIPMKNNQGKAIGCFQAINKASGESFDEGDEQFGLAFSSQAAVAIESALLHEKNRKVIDELEKTHGKLRDKIRQIEVIREIERLAHEVSHPKDFFSEFSRVLLETLGVGGVLILLQWNQGKWLVYLREAGEASKLQEFAVDTSEELEAYVGSIHKSVGDGQYEVADERKGPKCLEDKISFAIKSRISIPISFQKQMISGENLSQVGLFQVCDERDSLASDLSGGFLSIISGNIARTIEKKLLLDSQAQSGRLATIGQLSSTIFHDFKNPMASIRGIAELIGMSTGSMEDEQIVKFTSMIQGQVDRCVGMIEELLSFTRGEKNFNFQKASLKEFMTYIGDLVKIEADRNKIQFHINCESDCEFTFDRDKLMRVVFNLTNNAFEILDEGNTLEISARELDEQFVEITITDSGPGVPTHLQDTLFEVFVTHGKKNGTGLGLNISKQIVEGHSGSIVLDKGYKKGARFVIKLSKDPSHAG